MHARLVGVFLPDREILLDIDPFHAVQRHDVKIAHGLIVLGRVAGCDDDKALGHLVVSEHLVLQKLQHGRRQRLRDAVDLIQKEDALRDAGRLDPVIDRRDDLAHGVFRDGVLLPAVLLAGDEGKADGALSGVVGDRVGDQADPQFLGDLLHDGGLADAGRSHEENGPLPLRRNFIGAGLVLVQVGPDGIDDFLFGFFNVQFDAQFVPSRFSTVSIPSGVRNNFIAQSGTPVSSSSSSRQNTNAVS